MKRAHVLVAVAVIGLALAQTFRAQQTRDPRAEVALQAAIKIETIDGNLRAAIDAYEKVVASFASDRAVAAAALVRAGQCYERLGEAQAREARAFYGRVVREYADQTEVAALARARLAAIGEPVGARGPVTRRILADASDVRGVLSADGKCILHLDWAGGDVIQFEIASGQTSRIANQGTRVERVYYVEGYAFSRDGRRVAFDKEKRDGGWDLWVRHVNGSDLRALYSGKAVQPFDWSPDGRSVLALRSVSGEADKNQLVLISTADGSVRVLREIVAAWYMLTKARFSPDGRYVAFSLVGEGRPAHGDLYVVSVDGRDETVVAAHPAEDELLDWTPDGGLLFRSDRSGTWDIWSIRMVAGRQVGEPELLKKDFGRYSRVAGLAPDGSLYYRTITPSGRLYVGEIDIETGKVLVPPAPVTTRYNGAPSRIMWSPDGKRLLYVSFGSAMGNGNNNLTIRSVDTGEERFLATSLRNVWDIRWAPDGRTLLAWGMTVTGNAQFLVDVETGELTKLAEGRWAPRMSKDGKVMVYMDGQGGIRRRSLETGEDSAVKNTALRRFQDLSPDGREVVFQDSGAVRIAPLDGGEPRELLRDPLWLSPEMWTSDGRYIIVQAIDTKTGRYAGTSEIWRIPVQGGAPLKLDLGIAGMGNFALHPDTRRFAFGVNEGTRSELWALDNFLPPPKPSK